MRRAGLKYVLLAGQGSKIFAVREMIEKLSMTVPLIEKYQESAVSLGLCYCTGVMEGLVKEALLLDTFYTSINIRCHKEGEDVDVIVSGNADENNVLVTLLKHSTHIPTEKRFKVALACPVSERVRLEFVEVSTIKGVKDAPIGSITVETSRGDTVIDLSLNVDANKTIVVSVENPVTKRIEAYQFNNFFFFKSDVAGFEFPERQVRRLRLP